MNLLHVLPGTAESSLFKEAIEFITVRGKKNFLIYFIIAANRQKNKPLSDRSNGVSADLIIFTVGL